MVLLNRVTYVVLQTHKEQAPTSLSTVTQEKQMLPASGNHL